jgi:serine/threonine-protein kinase
VQPAQQATNASTTIAQQNPSAPTDANAGGPAARASEVQPLRELAAAQAAEAQPQQVARVVPPPPPAPPRPHIPTIAVIGGGDNNVAEPAERMIEEALSRRGFNVLDEASMPRIGHLFAGERPRYDEALNLLARQGRVDAVVFVHARDVGAEQLAAYGQVSNVVTAQLRIKAYSVEQRRPLGSDWSDAVHFSSLNAADQTTETVKPWLGDIAESLQAFRPHRDRG